MDSRELTGWMALIKVHEVEREQQEEAARHKRDSDDGEVIAFGAPRTEFDDDGEDEDGGERSSD